MFGYRGGDSQGITERKQGERRFAKERWPFLTTLDLSTLHSEAQLASMVQDRTRLPASEAANAVDLYMDDYNIRVHYQPPLDRSSSQRWSDDGGAVRVAGPVS